ncbi:MAG TPA: nicotinamide riboside transporter PnuC [Thermoanaerobaculia bacterium]
MSAFELVAAVITALSIWLATRENIWYYPTGLVALAMYTWVYFGAKLYAESVLQVICFALMVYGWYEWLHGGAHKTELPVTRTPRWAWMAGVAFGVTGSALVIAFQLRFTDNPNPYVDSSLFVWSLVAQWMTARKWIENWSVWIVINTISVPLYFIRGLLPTTALYVVLWILAVLGYRQWRKTLVVSAS